MAKTCKPGYYWCYTDKKCKKIPVGWHVGRSGIIEKDDEDTKKIMEMMSPLKLMVVKMVAG